MHIIITYIVDSYHMIMTSCPAESDAREKVSDFVSDRGIGSIGGLRTDGFDFLVELVKVEILKQEPESEMRIIDRDYLCDHGIDFARDLRKDLDEATSQGKRVNWIVVQDVPVNDWQTTLDVLKGRDTQVYLFTTACRQVPCCFKLIQ